MAKRDFLTITDFSRKEIEQLFDLAKRMKARGYRETTRRRHRRRNRRRGASSHRDRRRPGERLATRTHRLHGIVPRREVGLILELTYVADHVPEPGFYRAATRE